MTDQWGSDQTRLKILKFSLFVCFFSIADEERETCYIDKCFLFVFILSCIYIYIYLCVCIVKKSGKLYRAVRKAILHFQVGNKNECKNNLYIYITHQEFLSVIIVIFSPILVISFSLTTSGVSVFIMTIYLWSRW